MFGEAVWFLEAEVSVIVSTGGLLMCRNVECWGYYHDNLLAVRHAAFGMADRRLRCKTKRNDEASLSSQYREENLATLT